MVNADEHDEARAADQLLLRAHQLAVHGLGQRQHGGEALLSVFGEVDTHRDAAEVFAATLGVLWAAMSDEQAMRLADTLRGRIPALLMRAEGGAA